MSFPLTDNLYTVNGHLLSRIKTYDPTGIGPVLMKGVLGDNLQYFSCELDAFKEMLAGGGDADVVVAYAEGTIKHGQ